MSRFLLVLLMLMPISCVPLPHSPAAEPRQRLAIGGVLATDTVLDGDYLLTADLQVPAGITLTILPGSSIAVVASDSTKIDPDYLSKETEILIRGRLLAQGTAARPIRFMVDSGDKSQILWAGLAFVDSLGSRLEHLQIEQAETGILCLDSSPQLRFVQVLRSRYAILLQQHSSPVISDSLLSAGEAGLFCWDQSAPTVERTVITGNQEEGVYLGRGCAAELRENLISENDRGLVLPQGVAVAPSNRIVANRLNLHSYPPENTE